MIVLAIGFAQLLVTSANAAPPSVTLTGLTDGETVSGTIELGANATDDVGVIQTKWYVDGVEVGWRGWAPPWHVSWNSNTVASGSHTAFAKAGDAAGNWGTSPSVRFTVADSTPPPPAPAAIDPSGQPTPVGDLPGWRQIFVDDFSKSVALGSFPAAVSDKWSAYPYPWRDSARTGWYYPERVVSVHDGMMDLYLHTESVEGVMKHLTSAPMPRLPPYTPFSGQTYGRYAVRFRADPIPSYKTAWLLWPTSNVWPRDGEIDFPEGYLNGQICAFMHRQNGTWAADQDGWCTTATYPTWHTAVIEWTPLVCRFILDGHVFLAPTSRIPNNPMRWVLQTESTPDHGPISNSTSGHIYIDWVAAYAYAPS